jgi:hypothetical protein
MLQKANEADENNQPDDQICPQPRRMGHIRHYRLEFQHCLEDVATTHVMINGIVRATTDRKQLAICNPFIIEERHVA